MGREHGILSFRELSTCASVRECVSRTFFVYLRSSREFLLDLNPPLMTATMVDVFNTASRLRTRN